MAEDKKEPSLARRAGLTLISLLAVIVLGWLFLYGKIKAKELLSPILGKIPKDETGLVKSTEEVLGSAIERIKGKETLQVAAEKSSQFFETSDYAEPAREIREDVKSKVNEVVDSAKELPTRELKVIQRQICKEWLGEEVATESGSN
ncbi:MAG: hypothetical protein M1514_02550 [Patescibacteria group bacterium]|nr:hypothetical protein [Patescibacteria group bacterium]